MLLVGKMIRPKGCNDDDCSGSDDGKLHRQFSVKYDLSR
jgi:hypothetical protein